MDNFYRDNILDHYKNPRNFGRLKSPDLTTEEENVSCGDRIGIDIKIITGNRQTAAVKDISFFGEGCAISTASASLLTEQVKGREFSKILKLNKSSVLSLLGIDLTPARLKCALLPLEAIHRCLALYKGK